MEKIILDHETESKIIELYKSGKSAMTISKIFNLSDGKIKKTLKNNGIILRKYYEINKKHKINDHYFDNIDSEEKAYFLGFLYSDGNVNSKYNSITLKLQNRDMEILKRLSKLICNEDILYFGDFCTLRFSSKYIKDALINIGCVPNKTFKLKFPILDDKLIPHFLRGYFDGDGCINRYKNDFYISIIATEDFCISINNIIKSIFDIDVKIYKDKKMVLSGNNITSVIYYKGNRRAEKVMDWLYKDATIYLERKHSKYLELKSWIKEVDGRTSRYSK